METPLTILQQYWKHSRFRPLQEEIVQSVLDGYDTLALLPTGGGKSVCFQVPAMLREGLCIVISPLIALMKDQVEQLKKRHIIAAAVHSGMSRQEIDVMLNNALYGGIKFLYVSPERIQTEIFTERVKQMRVGLIAVDEAHCISQWGYDFRPPYLEIATLRELKPDVPVIALTATATALVKADIVEKLAFREPKGIFQRSFARDNLQFVVRKTENKDNKLLEILQKVKGPAIVYVRSRKSTQDIARVLNRRGVKALFYHAGLTFEERTARQDEWIENKSRVMVATNAFGMGIDKPDVRAVVHMDLPENLESYYQEAGRAGRDGQRSFAAIIYQDADVHNLRTKVEQSLPTIEYLKRVYQALANFYQLAVGSAEGESFDFDLHQFCDRFHFNQIEVYNALKKLEEEGLIQFNESFYSPSSLHIQLDHAKLYEFQVANARFDPLIKMALRLYGGELFSGMVKISEPYVAKALSLTAHETIKQLKHLHELKVILYAQAKDTPQLTFVAARQDADHLALDHARLESRKKLITAKMEAMIGFVTTTHQCRMLMVQQYFDEQAEQECGICDVCIAKRKTENTQAYGSMRDEILAVMKKQTFTLEQLEAHLAPRDRELFVDVVRELVDEGVLAYDSAWKLSLA